MIESATAASPDSYGSDHDDPDGPTAALRARGAHRFDPVRFGYIEALARRAAAHAGDARQMLDRKLEHALAAYGERYEKARIEAGDAIAHMATRFPEAAELMHRLHGRSDFSGIRRLTARLEGQSRGRLLADLVDYMDRQSADHGAPAHAAGAAAIPTGLPAELKALRHFRNTWAQLSVERQLTRSQANAPENPGPLNSHLLVLRALQCMQEVSPAYLERFMSHVDALLWLDQASLANTPKTSKVARQENDRNRKPGRGKRA